MTNDERNLFDATQGLNKREGKFDLKKYWQDPYVGGGNSGAGSYNEEAAYKAFVINHWMKEYGMRRINEIGCGDGNNLFLYDVPISYTGYDISPKAVQICEEKFHKHRNRLKYIFTSDMNMMDYEADVCLCLDVWYHQIEEQDFEDLCKLLFEVGKWKYIIIYSTDTDSQFTEDGTPLAKHVKFRPVLDKVAQYPQWEVAYWSSGIRTAEDKYYNFPSMKKFFLLNRKE